MAQFTGLRLSVVDQGRETGSVQSGESSHNPDFTLNRSFPRLGADGKYTNVISPVVIPRDSRSYFWVFQTLVLAVFGVAASAASSWWFLPGPQYWILVLAFVGVIPPVPAWIKIAEKNGIVLH